MGPSWACATMPPLEHKIIAAAQQALTSCLQANRTAPLFMADPIWQAHRARRGRGGRRGGGRRGRGGRGGGGRRRGARRRGGGGRRARGGGGRRAGGRRC